MPRVAQFEVAELNILKPGSAAPQPTYVNMMLYESQVPYSGIVRKSEQSLVLCIERNCITRAPRMPLVKLFSLTCSRFHWDGSAVGIHVFKASAFEDSVVTELCLS